MVSVSDFAIRPARALGDGEELSLGSKRVRWFDAPHLPHNWECGYLIESTTRTLLCGDLFTQGGADGPPITESEVLGPVRGVPPGDAGGQRGDRARAAARSSRSWRRPSRRTLALMHGSSYRGDGAKLLRGLADVLDA